MYAATLLLFLEIFCKVLVFTPLRDVCFTRESEIYYRADFVVRHLSHSGVFSYVYEYDAERGWKLKSNLKNAPYAGATVSSNSDGIRSDREFSRKKASGTTRVVVIGDSFMFGEESTQGETFPDFLQKKLGDDYEVMNMGVSGYGHDQMLLYLEGEVLKYRPDVVLLGFYGADIYRNTMSFRDFAKPRYELGGEGLRLTGVPVMDPSAALWSGIFRLHSVDVAVYLWQRTKEKLGIGVKERERVTQALLDRMAERSRWAGARFVVLQIPKQDTFVVGDDPSGSEAFAARLTAAAKTEYFSPREYLVSHRRPEYKMTGHYGAAINSDLADFTIARIFGKTAENSG